MKSPIAVGLFTAAPLFALALAIGLLGATLPAASQDLDTLFREGMAALEAAHTVDDEEHREALLDHAIAAFHAMLVVRPDLPRVHLEIARAFFLKGEDDLARRHFELVLSHGPPETVAANINHFLSAIRARNRWSFTLGMAIAPDSNVGAASGDEIIFIDTVFGRLPFTLDRPAQQESGIGLALWSGAEYQVALEENLRLRAGALASRRDYEQSNFDQFHLATHLGPRFLIDPTTEASVLLSARQAWLGTVTDYHDVGLRLEAGHRLSESVTLFPRASWHGRRYRTRTWLDGPVWDAFLSAAWIVSPIVKLEATVGYTRDRPTTVRERNRSRLYDLGISVNLPEGFTVGAGGGERRTGYESGWWPFVPDGSARKDRIETYRLSAHNRGITVLGFSPEVVAIREFRDSNAQLHSYDRTSGELRFVQQF